MFASACASARRAGGVSWHEIAVTLVFSLKMPSAVHVAFVRAETNGVPPIALPLWRRPR